MVRQLRFEFKGKGICWVIFFSIYGNKYIGDIIGTGNSSLGKIARNIKAKLIKDKEVGNNLAKLNSLFRV